VLPFFRPVANISRLAARTLDWVNSATTKTVTISKKGSSYERKHSAAKL
jgi:hypothetical protein